MTLSMPDCKHLRATRPIDSLLAHAQALTDAGQFAAARQLLSVVLEASSGTDNHPLQAEILTRLGLLHRELCDFDRALAAFLIAHRLQPSDTLKAYIAEQQRDY